jgi:tRNA-Thr(GGU) m(6)t(6)A37 methyltransferase TsaA
MTAPSPLRPGELTIDTPSGFDAGLWFIGRIATPWKHSTDCPRRGDPVNGLPCQVTVFAPWHACLAGVEGKPRLLLLYWMHHARRDVALQSPARDGQTTGTFALRSPLRPNPIAASVVTLLGIDGSTLVVRGLDCIDGTPLLDIKPDVAAMAPLPVRLPRDG